MTEEKTFNILDHLAGRTYPEDTVKVYFDEAAMRAVVILEDEINNEKDPDVVNKKDKEIETLRERIEKTSLTFHLKGFPDDVKEALKTKADAIEDKEERAVFQDISALEASITRVENAEGARATFDYDGLLAIARALPAPEWERLITKVVELSYRAVIYERVETNPDF